MSERVEALVLQMSVKLNQLEKGMEAGRKKVAKELGEIETKTGKTAKAVSSHAASIGESFKNLAGEIPIVGEALVGLGPAGVAFGAAAAVIAVGVKGIYDGAQKARSAIDDLATSAENVAVSAESFQAFKALGIELDVTFDKIEGGLNKLQIGAAEAANGTGALYTGLSKINPALLQTIVNASTQEDRWDALSKAITATDDQLTKVAIAKAAFGKTGAQFVRLLDGEDKTVRNLTNRYRELGVILSEDLVASVGAADQRMQLAQARMDALALRANAAWIPAVEGVTNAWLGLNLAVASFFDGFNDPKDQQITTLQDQIAHLKSEMAPFLKQAERADFSAAARQQAAGYVAGLTAQIAILQAEIDAKKSTINRGATSEYDGPLTLGGLAGAAGAFVGDKGKATLPKLAALEAERNKQRQQAAQYLYELGDATQLVKIKEDEYARAAAAGLITRAQAATLTENYRLSLSKVTDAQKDAAAQEKIWIALLEQAKTPTDRAQEALMEFWQAVQFGTIGDPARAADILAILTKNLQDAEAAARAASPELQKVAEARAAIAAAQQASASYASRAAAERKRVDGLVGVGGFTQGEADQSFAVWTANEDAEVREGMRAAVKDGIRQGITTDDWGAQIRSILAEGVVSGLEDALNRLADTLTDIVLGKQGGDGGLLGAAGKFIFGGARANGGGVSANKSYLVGENGPELLRMGPGQNGRILNANQVNSLQGGGGGGGGAYVDARITIGGVDMATWPQVRAALDAQARAIAARVPGAVNATLISNRRQKRRI